MSSRNGTINWTRINRNLKLEICVHRRMINVFFFLNRKINLLSPINETNEFHIVNGPLSFRGKLDSIRREGYSFEHWKECKFERFLAGKMLALPARKRVSCECFREQRVRGVIWRYCKAALRRRVVDLRDATEYGQAKWSWRGFQGILFSPVKGRKNWPEFSSIPGAQTAARSELPTRCMLPSVGTHENLEIHQRFWKKYTTFLKILPPNEH